MYYVGVDLHKETSWFYVVDSSGKKILSKNIANNKQSLKNFLAKIPQPFTLAVEATYNWYFLIDIAEEFANKVYLANSYELKAFAKQHKKTDKIDAALIANILQKGFLPIVYIADKTTREQREFLRYRMNLVSDRTRNISRLKMILDKIGIDFEGDFTTNKSLVLLRDKHKQKGLYKEVVDDYTFRIEDLIKNIRDIEKNIKEISTKDEDIKRLCSIIGISYFSGALIKTEIVTIDRFKSFNRLCAYAGLAPKVSQSANKKHSGCLNKNSRKNLRWILLEIVYHFINGYPEKKQKFERLKKEKNFNVAKVVLARDLLKAVYIVLKNKRNYLPNKSSLVAINAL